MTLSNRALRSLFIVQTALALGALGLGACTTTDTIICNPGFVENDGACVAIDGGAADASLDVSDAGPPPADATPDTFDGGPDAGPCGVCADETPLCDTTTTMCVECLAPMDCTGAAGMCSDAGECVECLGDADCTEAGASVCSTDGACVACTAGSATDCAGVMDGGTALNVCDDSAGAGECVQCNAGDESACGDRVCDVVAKMCTTTPAGMSPTCGECVSDRQCAAGQVCAGTMFMGMDAGHYCLWDLGAPEMAPEFCTDVLPFGTPRTLMTLAGASAEVCTLRLSTCAAYNDFSTPGRGAPSCAGSDTPEADADCGHPDLADGFCARLGGLSRCTTACTSADDCVFEPADTRYQCMGGLCRFTPE